MVVSSRRDPQVVRDIISAAIVYHDLPFKFVEWTWIKRLTEYLCESVNLVSRNTAKADVISLFSREKQKIKTMLENTPGTKYPTSNLFFPKVFSTYMLLKQNKESSDVFLQKMATQMYNKYYKYWGEFSIILEYEAYNLHEDSIVCIQKSQLEMYLVEPKLEISSNLDVLDFWRVNVIHYPDLSLMARDILSIPVSTVTSKSAFSVGDRVVDRYRSLLKPDVVEAIVCTRDWMQMDNECDNVPVEPTNVTRFELSSASTKEKYTPNMDLVWFIAHLVKKLDRPTQIPLDLVHFIITVALTLQSLKEVFALKTFANS
ncbi:hypothetical protein Ddye_028935 [Dipteronia dyeriana]|uniref:HAT C-terminal dimerisation domain-containing protein n=1 Tax=Dipteronia dyeriana TaxID=168575 RepID=A0AAD9WLB8_9ROSI|nr:hypothetical protein Ddye_028935 [Dipteronia dyeriana]